MSCVRICRPLWAWHPFKMIRGLQCGLWLSGSQMERLSFVDKTCSLACHKELHHWTLHGKLAETDRLPKFQSWPRQVLLLSCQEMSIDQCWVYKASVGGSSWSVSHMLMVPSCEGQGWSPQIYPQLLKLAPLTLGPHYTANNPPNPGVGFPFVPCSIWYCGVLTSVSTMKPCAANGPLKGEWAFHFFSSDPTLSLCDWPLSTKKVIVPLQYRLHTWRNVCFSSHEGVYKRRVEMRTLE